MNCELEKYLDSDTLKKFNFIFMNEANKGNTKDILKYIISKASSKTFKKLLVAKLDIILYKITYLITQADLYDFNDSIKHMNYMLDRQFIYLRKLSSILNKTDDIEELKSIYLNANAMIYLSEYSIKYYNDLLGIDRMNDKGISYMPGYTFNISINKNEMNTITSNIKKLAK